MPVSRRLLRLEILKFQRFGNVSKDHRVDSADLYPAGISGRQCTGSVPGRTDRRRDRGCDNVDLVSKKLQKSTGGNETKIRNARYLIF